MCKPWNYAGMVRIEAIDGQHIVDYWDRGTWKNYSSRHLRLEAERDRDALRQDFKRLSEEQPERFRLMLHGSV